MVFEVMSYNKRGSARHAITMTMTSSKQVKRIESKYIPSCHFNTINCGFDLTECHALCYEVFIVLPFPRGFSLRIS